MRERIALNQRQAAFVKLIAANPDLSTVECFVRAGYAGRDSANAHALKKRLAEFIAEERAKLGCSDAEASPAVDDEEVAALLKQARETHKLAVEAGDLKTAAKSLRVIERALKKAGRPGRPVAATPHAQTSGEAPARMPPGEFAGLVDSILELPEIEEDSALT